MPLILEPEAWSLEQLREQATDLTEGLAHLGRALDERRGTPSNPYAFDSCLELLRRSVDLGREVLADPSAPPRLLARLANQLYEVGNSMPYLLRSAQAPPPPFPSRTAPSP